jgi:hypothetical protein
MVRQPTKEDVSLGTILPWKIGRSIQGLFLARKAASTRVSNREVRQISSAVMSGRSVLSTSATIQFFSDRFLGDLLLPGEAFPLSVILDPVGSGPLWDSAPGAGRWFRESSPLVSSARSRLVCLMPPDPSLTAAVVFRGGPGPSVPVPHGRREWKLRSPAADAGSEPAISSAPDEGGVFSLDIPSLQKLTPQILWIKQSGLRPRLTGNRVGPPSCVRTGAVGGDTSARSTLLLCRHIVDRTSTSDRRVGRADGPWR